VFYFAGQTLVSLPAEFHDDKLWKARVMGTLEGRSSDDE
jgi:hypothetical protein